MKMIQLPEEIQIYIFSFICPTPMIAVNRRVQILCKCNYIWGPIVYRTFGIRHSDNFWEEFKWQTRLRKHRLHYQRQWTLGCVGKIHSLGNKPKWRPAYTTWAPC